MRNSLWVLLVLLTTVLLSCNDDDILPSEPEIDLGFIVLKHDGPNVNAPVLPPNTYEAAARFTSSDLGVATGGKLEEIHYYIQAPPDQAEIRVYLGSQNNNPERLLYQRDITREIRAGAWNKHVIITPLTLNADDLWIAIRFSQSLDQRTMGCDPGPAVVNGDWLWDSADGQWVPLRQRAPININWNIRAAVDR